MGHEWSLAQDGRPGIGGLITYDPRQDVVVWNLPLHQAGQVLVLRLYPHDHLFCLTTKATATVGEPTPPAV